VLSGAQFLVVNSCQAKKFPSASGGKLSVGAAKIVLGGILPVDVLCMTTNH